MMPTFTPGQMFSLLFRTLGPMKVFGPCAKMTRAADETLARQIAVRGTLIASLAIVAAAVIGIGLIVGVAAVAAAASRPKTSDKLTSAGGAVSSSGRFGAARLQSSPGMGGLSGGQIFLGAGAGSVTGVVGDGPMKVVPGATVVLVPDTLRRSNRALYVSAISDASGRFILRGVAPGDYKVFAWECIPAFTHVNDAFMAKHEDRGKLVHMNQQGTVNTELTIIPAVSK